MVTSIARPSYSQGYARNKSESLHPTLWDGLKGAWSPLLGNTGVEIRDLSGFGNHGTISGTTLPTWILTSDATTAGRLNGYAIDFNDTDNEMVMTGSNAHLDLVTPCMSCWFNITDDHASGGNLTGLGGAVNNGSWFMQAITTGRVKFSCDQSTSDLIVTSATSSYNQNEWNLLTVHWDGGTAASGVTMWLNGVDITAGASTTDGGGVKSATQDFQIVSSGQGHVQIALGLIHDRKLTNQEAYDLWAYPGAPFIKKSRDVFLGVAAAAVTDQGGEYQSYLIDSFTRDTRLVAT